MRADSTCTGRRVDDVLQHGVVHASTGEAPRLAVINAWSRREMVRVVGADGRRAAAPAATLAYRLRAGDAILVHESVGDDLQQWRGAGAAAAVAGDAGGRRTAPHGTPPRWLGSALRWHSDDVAVISKPPGVATQGGSGIAPTGVVDTWLPTLARMHLPPPPRGSEGEPPLRLVHRLDRDVGGLLLLARSRAAAEACRLALAGREGAIRKTYVAVVVGPPLPTGVPWSGTINVPVRGGDQAGADDTTTLTPALSRYTVLPPPLPPRAPPATQQGGAAACVLLMEPVTGRKHQLRQHAVALWRGTAGIAGDRKYGGGGGRVVGASLLLHAVHLQLAPHLAGTPSAVDVFDALPPAFAPYITDDAQLRAAIRAFAAGRRPLSSA